MAGSNCSGTSSWKKSVMLLATTTGGLSAVAVLTGNWLFAGLFALLAIFKDEGRIAGRYLTIVLLVVICPGWSWERKKQNIRFHTKVFIQVLEKDLVKKFLNREVV